MDCELIHELVCESCLRNFSSPAAWVPLTSATDRPRKFIEIPHGEASRQRLPRPSIMLLAPGDDHTVHT